MAKLLEMPKLSPTMEEGQISTWHKKEGDAVAVDDLLAEVETDKATMEFRSFDQGTLLKILAPDGAVVKLGQPVAILGKAGEDVSALMGSGGAPPGEKSPPAAGKTPIEASEQRPAHGQTPIEASERRPADGQTPIEASESRPADGQTPIEASERGPAAPQEAIAAPASAVPGERVKASPYVRKVAREQGVDLHGLSGSGPNGRIVARDLASAVVGASPQASSSPGKLAEPESRPLSMMRKAIAKRLVLSKQTVPHFYLTIDVDADPLQSLRERINEDLAASAEKGAEPQKVSLNDLIIRACAIALVHVPECNAEFTAEAILVHRRVDISVAVAVPDGLVTPVVRNADKKTVLAIAAEVRDLAARAKQKKLKPEEMANGTFSISNLGMYGVDSFAAVINPPEGAILAVGQVRREPVVRGDAVVPGRKLAMTLSCDHRVVDGAVGATFLKALRQLIEHPTQILL